VSGGSVYKREHDGGHAGEVVTKPPEKSIVLGEVETSELWTNVNEFLGILSFGHFKYVRIY